MSCADSNDVDLRSNGDWQPKISPDGTRVALAVGPLGQEDIWIWDEGRKTKAVRYGHGMGGNCFI